MDLHGKVALVTGGAAGMGLEYVKILLENGVKHVAILDVNKRVGSEVVKIINEKFGEDTAIFISCDVSKKDDLKDAFEKTVSTFKNLHIVINNAGIMRGSMWEQEISLNFAGTVSSTFLALDYMSKDKGGEGGAIVNISSVVGLNPTSVVPVYSGTKAGIIAFSQSMGKPFHEDRTGVRVVVLCPGVTFTSLLTDAPQYIQDEAWIMGAIELISQFPVQAPDCVAAGLLHILKNAKSQSVWVAEDSKPPYELDFPHYETIKVKKTLVENEDC